MTKLKNKNILWIVVLVLFTLASWNCKGPSSSVNNPIDTTGENNSGGDGSGGDGSGGDGSGGDGSGGDGSGGDGSGGDGSGGDGSGGDGSGGNGSGGNGSGGNGSGGDGSGGDGSDNTTDGSLEFQVNNGLLIPLDIEVNAYPGNGIKEENETLTLNASVTNFTGTVNYTWYIDGDEATAVSGTSLVIDNTWEVGEYQIDLIAFGSGVMGSFNELLTVASPLDLAVAGVPENGQKAQSETLSFSASISNYSGNVAYTWSVDGVDRGSAATFDLDDSWDLGDHSIIVSALTENGRSVIKSFTVSVVAFENPLVIAEDNGGLSSLTRDERWTNGDYSSLRLTLTGTQSWDGGGQLGTDPLTDLSAVPGGQTVTQSFSLADLNAALSGDTLTINTWECIAVKAELVAE